MSNWHRTSMRLLLTLVLAMLFHAPSTHAEQSDPQRPNFVFLLVDDLGWGDFGCYGSQFHETPHIDALAEQGMKFDNAYAACAVCSPSRAAILTGCYPARLRLTDWITGHKRPYAKLAVPDWKMKIDHERVLLPEALKEAGYATGFFGKWHLMPIGQDDFADHYPTDHGFDVNVGGREWGQPKGPGKYFSPFGVPNLDNGKPSDFLTDRLTDSAVDFLESTPREQPFLLYLSYYTLHGPIMSPPELVQKYKEKAKTFKNENNEHLDPARAGMVERLDASVGRLAETLRKLDLADNTVVILTGDNGGNFAGTSGGLRDFKGFSHEGGTREPLIVRWPGVTEEGSVCSEPVIGTDFYPTMLEIADLPARPDQHQDGVSIVSLLRGDTSTLERDALYWHYPHYHRTDPYGAIRKGDWKLIEFFENGELELYNLADDPAEENNLAKTQPERAERMLQAMRQWRKSTDAQMMTDNPNHRPNQADQRARPQRAKKTARSKAG
ncbi:sulfatase [Rhodopirellula sallentina]|uniref:Arylsulfatase A n=1 Tax=Rhodopirellula sallentina SM41 TaxID=1263870 RepID=M5TRG3_9BACT|nr:sulfatase [Rhodopirellula sallentina]EMI51767.1 arylsulfatase A [Rhodopirellula sallentina SM41]